MCPAGPLVEMRAAYELTDDHRVNARCERGHEFPALISNPRHELLFEMSLRALSDGYLREAVMNASAALERCLEFFAVSALVPEPGPIEEGKGWPIMADEQEAVLGLRARLRKQWGKQSERQVGAFLFAHAQLCGDLPKWCAALSERAKLRNSVVHGGQIPTADETLDYCRWVYEAITTTMTTLRIKKRHWFVWSALEGLVGGRGTSFAQGVLLTAINHQTTPAPFDDVIADLDRPRPWAPLADIYALARFRQEQQGTTQADTTEED
jgi:hypothetical protein